MCGIAGQISFDREPEFPKVEQMAEALRHRGPDDSGSYISPSRTCVLAHRRLSIIDLSPKGRQPMTTEDGRYTIVFNGEIYNYLELRDELLRQGVQFRSTSDTEVLLKLWEREKLGCLQKIRGMFAFAVWDEAEKTLTLVRDPLGIKPVYYYLDGKCKMLSFASELKALRAVGLARGVDPDG